MKKSSRPNVLSQLCLSLILACGIVSTSSALAEDVLLNSSSVRGSSPNLRLIRTSMTPSKVELELPVAMDRTVCAEYGTRVVSGQSGMRCGYDRVIRRVCVPAQVCHVNRQTGKTECSMNGRRCYDEMNDIPRFCSWEETYCVRTETRTSDKTKIVTLKFKNLAKLGSGEQEVFELRGEQNHTDGQEAVFRLTAVDTRKPVKITEKDGVFTGFKDVIVIKGE